MKRDISWGVTAAVALAAMIGVSTQRGGRPDAEMRPRSASTQTKRVEARDVKDQFERGPCTEIETHLQDFLMGGRTESRAAPVSCYADLKQLPRDEQARGDKLRDAARHLRFVIATLPDPMHTHLSLSFDRATEAIQESVSDDEYVYDSSWLPWDTQEAPYALISDQDEAEDRRKRQEEQPGILLFRHKMHRLDQSSLQPDEIFSDGLAVFIVGEEPTQGLHRTQFMNAAAWIAALHPHTGAHPPAYMLPDSGILGPSFSGSLPSLATLLEDGDLAKQLQAGADPLLIYSGTISGGIGVQWFNDSSLVQQNAIRFASFQQSDDVLLRSYCSYLLGEGFSLRRLAIVSEDETAYGAALVHNPAEAGAPDQQPAGCFQKNGASTGLVRLYYPRGIAVLRSAYQKQSIFSSDDASSTGTGRRTLSSDIADPEGQQHDTIREYNTGQLPQSQEGVLQQLVSQLRAHQTEYIVLRSSNPLDQLFLSHYLRMAYPHGRIVILGADVLLRRESGAARLSGIMTITTYPLLPWEPHWTRNPADSNDHSHRVYPQDSAEGIYVATRFLLHAHGLKKEEQLKIAGFVPTDPTLTPPIPDYAPPIWSRKPQIGAANSRAKPVEPPTGWLSVLGRDDFWPVAALETMQEESSSTTGRKCDADLWRKICWISTATLSLGHVFYPPSAQSAPLPGTAQVPMPLSMKLTLFALFLWALFHLACCRWSSITSGPNHRSYFVCPPGSYLQHRTLLVMGCLTLSSSATTLAWGCGVMATEGTLPEGAWACALTALVVWILAGAALAINLVRERRLSSAPAEPIRWPLLDYAAGTLAYYYALYWSTERTLSSYNRIPVYWRSMNLTNGVSPVVPFLILSIGAYWWMWRSLQGLAFFGPDAPVLPRRESLEFPNPKQTASGPLPCMLDRLNMFSRERAADPVMAQCKPLARRALAISGIMLITQWILAWLLGFDREEPIRSLGARSYAQFVCFLISILVAVMLANTGQLLWIWIGLRRLLVHLDRVPLRRSMAAIRGVSWNSVWKISGNVLDLRYKLIISQLECATHFENALNEANMKKYAFLKGDFGYRSLHGPAQAAGTLDALHNARIEFGDWYAKNWDNASLRKQDKMKDLQESFAALAGKLLASVLLPAWRLETEDLFPGDSTAKRGADTENKEEQKEPKAALAPHIRHAEELVCYVYLGFIQNVLGRMRTLVMGIMGLFVAATISLACYPFDPRTVVNAVMILLFVVLGTVIVMVYAQMHRDPILSALTNTKPGELDTDFWIKLISFGAGPVLGLLATIFPEMTDFLFSWVAPGVSAVK